MKKALILIVFTLMSVMTMVGQTSTTKVERQGNKFVEVPAEKETPYQYIDKKGIEYPIYVMENDGRCFYYKVSKKGNKSRKYLDEKHSKNICQEMGISYTFKKKE
jgi:hypothetical protein